MFAPAILEARRARVAAALPDDSAVLFGAGTPIDKPGGQDQTYPFIPYPEYYWLTGSRRHGGVLAWSPDKGWAHFVRPVSAAERLWEGDPRAPEGLDIAELGSWLAGQGAPRLIGGRPAELTVALVPVGEDDDLQRAVDATRRTKDAAEIALIERAVRATAAGHARAAAVIAAGVTERRVQIELEAEMFRHGADAMGYGTIVGAGTHGAVLHFSPGERAIEDGDLVLVDAGASIAGYTADVTRTYAAGALDERRQAIYDLVNRATDAGIAACRPGTEWHDVHRLCASTLASGLRELGLLRGSVESALETGAIAAFFPHGVGHMLGLGVRDVGGRADGREPARVCCGAVVRVDLPLEPGFLMTVEPGIYFVDAILDDPERRARWASEIAWDAVDAWRSVGGVRLEDNVLVTTDAPKNLTAAIPR